MSKESVPKGFGRASKQKAASNVRGSGPRMGFRSYDGTGRQTPVSSVHVLRREAMLPTYHNVEQSDSPLSIER